jgi:SAM-dependent methyltransferase
VAYYDQNALGFEADTAELDMSGLHERFLKQVPSGGRILDAGCGVGRDALAFAQRGFRVLAFDASCEMVEMARRRVSGLADIRQMRFEDIAWQGEFDGIWACASLLHIAPLDFPGVARKVARALHPQGICYMSFKHGTGERIVGGRCFVDHTETSFRSALAETGLEMAEVWLSSDPRPERAREQWLNAIARRGPRRA